MNFITLFGPVFLILLAAIMIVAIKESYKEKVEVKKCGCGKSESGYCDDSHNNTDNSGNSSS